LSNTIYTELHFNTIYDLGNHFNSLEAIGMNARICRMMNRAIHKLIITLFTALQCIAPVAHAHVTSNINDNSSHYSHLLGEHIQNASGVCSANVDEVIISIPDAHHRLNDPILTLDSSAVISNDRTSPLASGLFVSPVSRICFIPVALKQGNRSRAPPSSRLLSAQV
jgi:methionine-rich copper-binding protein CopC